MFELSDYPALPGRCHIVTEAELALGVGSKSIYRGDDSTVRYMKRDEEVSFSVIYNKDDYNAEFSINGKLDHRIWLSQLNLVFIDAEKQESHSGEIVYKDGQRLSMAGMSVRDFMAATDGKRFKAVVKEGWYAIDFYNQTNHSLGTVEAIQEYIRNAIAEARYGDVKGMTKSRPCYSLIEV